MVDYFRNVFFTTQGLVKGLSVTLRNMFTPAITVQYPYEKLKPSPRYRGALAFHPDICISCEMCIRACPSKCISLEAKRNEETKKKDLAWYKIDFGKCNYCRLCEEICPTKPKAVHHTREYELSFTRREDFIVNWTPQEPQPAGNEPGQTWSRFLTQGQKLGPNPATNASATPSAPAA
jgi:NADH-quinone oxidoreductase chain I